MTTSASVPTLTRDKGITKAVELLRALRVVPSGSARELAQATGLPRSTVQRLLSALAETQMLVQDPLDQRYRIGPLALWIGMGYRRGTDLVDLARPLLTQLRDASGETAGVSVAAGNARVFVGEVQSQSGLRYASEIGKLYPLWSGSMGRVLASRLPPDRLEELLADRSLAHEVERPLSPEQTRHLVIQARHDGYATAFGETLAGTSSIAVGVVDATGDTLAAISLGGPESRLDRERMLETLPLLRQVADQLSEQLGS